MEPRDVEKAKQIFRDRIRPAFESFEGCMGIDMHIGVDERSRDLVEVAAISRWDAGESIELAPVRPEYDEAMDHIRPMLQESRSCATSSSSHKRRRGRGGTSEAPWRRGSPEI